MLFCFLFFLSLHVYNLCGWDSRQFDSIFLLDPHWQGECPDLSNSTPPVWTTGFHLKAPAQITPWHHQAYFVQTWKNSLQNRKIKKNKSWQTHFIPSVKSAGCPSNVRRELASMPSFEFSFVTRSAVGSHVNNKLNNFSKHDFDPQGVSGFFFLLILLQYTNSHTQNVLGKKEKKNLPRQHSFSPRPAVLSSTSFIVCCHNRYTFPVKTEAIGSTCHPVTQTHLVHDTPPPRQSIASPLSRSSHSPSFSSRSPWQTGRGWREGVRNHSVKQELLTSVRSVRG